MFLRVAAAVDGSKTPYTKEELKAMLPKVGDVLMRRQIVYGFDTCKRSAPRRCEVVYVNEKHFWYKVRFMDGRCESFKMPEIGEDIERPGLTNRGGSQCGW